MDDKSENMRIDIITIFPGMFDGVINASIIKRAVTKGNIEIYIHNLRDFTADRHHTVDDRPYGGGSGMVMKPEPIFKAVKIIRDKAKIKNAQVILFSPKGDTFTQGMAVECSKLKHLILVCGHYEGVDERVFKKIADRRVSIGDYVLTGGEIPAMVVLDSLVRLIPGVLGDSGSLKEESFNDNLLEYPQYTRPRVYKGMKVPAVLLSGDHQRIEEWRRKQAVMLTQKKRPDLFQKSDRRCQS